METFWLVVDKTYPSEKYDFVNWNDYLFPIYGKINMFQSPPTSTPIFQVSFTVKWCYQIGIPQDFAKINS